MIQKKQPEELSEKEKTFLIRKLGGMTMDDALELSHTLEKDKNSPYIISDENPESHYLGTGAFIVEERHGKFFIENRNMSSRVIEIDLADVDDLIAFLQKYRRPPID